MSEYEEFVVFEDGGEKDVEGDIESYTEILPDQNLESAEFKFITIHGVGKLELDAAEKRLNELGASGFDIDTIMDVGTNKVILMARRKFS